MDSLDKEIIAVSAIMGIGLPLALMVISWLVRQPWLFKLGL